MTTRCMMHMLPLVTTLIVMVVAFSLRIWLGIHYISIHVGYGYSTVRIVALRVWENTVCHPYIFAAPSKGTSWSGAYSCTS